MWRLAFIRRGKEVGFTLKEIGELLGAGDDRSVAEVRRIAEKRLASLDRELADLADSRDRLQRLIQTCASGSGTDCVDLAPRPEPEPANPAEARGRTGAHQVNKSETLRKQGRQYL